MAGTPRALSPAQREVLERIRVPAEERPVWPDGLRAELRSRLEAELEPVLHDLPDDADLWVSKAALDGVNGCEARFLADTFEWSVPTARGRISHKAIELSVTWRGEPDAHDLTDEAVARLTEGDDALADWLQTCGEGTRTDLRGQVVTLVDTFLATFPPLTRGFRPAAESPRRVLLHQDRIALSGRFDLTVGVADGNRAGRVVIEIKTGATAPAHRDDLRFYALLETLVTGVPPLAVATFYPDRGDIDPEFVTDDVLEAAVRRTVRGARRLAVLRHDERVEPARRPGPPCRWCAISDHCDDGQAWLADADA